MRYARRWTAAALLGAAIGCGGGDGFKIAPVTGQVTLGGRPLEGAFVQFQPMAGGDTVNSGPPSVGTTDADGRFALAVAQDGRKGAMVGRHRVRISTYREETVAKDSDDVKIAQRELVPVKYNARTTLVFQVPEGGTTAADFGLDAK
ncbi:MAG TPA: carboxypeptidase regulatory-like domain-containing protein [Planctomycetia bacterium]|nr:carboxypeptidase regulatory-like domain-containing protein [Planctomycetia bacterium]